MNAQLSLFGQPAQSNPVSTGLRFGELCAEKAERDLADFRIRARQFVLDYLRAHGATAGEVITDMAIASGLDPHDARAFGPVFGYLAHKSRRQIVCVGLVPRQKGHGTAGGRAGVGAGMISERDRAANRRYYLRSRPARRLRLLLKSGTLSSAQRADAERQLEVEVAKLRATCPRPPRLSPAERAAADRAKAKRWSDRNRERASEKAARRTAAVQSQVCDCCTNEERAQWYWQARLCGWAVDHVQPLGRGGKHCCTNFQFLSKAENSSKGARWDDRCQRILAYNRSLSLRYRAKIGVVLSRIRIGQPHRLPKLPRLLKVMPLPAHARAPAP